LNVAQMELRRQMPKFNLTFTDQLRESVTRDTLPRDEAHATRDTDWQSLSLVDDSEVEALVGANQGFDFAVIDQAQRLPVRVACGVCFVAWQRVTRDALAQLIGEREIELGHLPSQLHLCDVQCISCEHIASRARLQGQSFNCAFSSL